MTGSAHRRHRIVVLLSCLLATAPLIFIPASAASAGTPDAIAVVTSVSPDRGSTDSHQPVLIRGTDLGTVTAVFFGARAASSVEVLSDGRLLATAPQVGSARTVDVTVRTSAGTSATSPDDRFSYLEPAALTQSDYAPHGRRDLPSAVDCVRPDWCAMLDDVGLPGNYEFTVVAGGARSEIPIPLPPGGTASDTTLLGLTCEAIGHCVAVGAEKSAAMITTLDGTVADSIAVPRLGGQPRSVLWDASCTRQRCTAVGAGYNDAHHIRRAAVVERDPAGDWQQVSVPWMPPLMRVSCSTDVCLAIGSDSAPAVAVRTAAGWQAGTPPTPDGGSALALTAADCYAEGSCVAVGSYLSADGTRLGIFERLIDQEWSAFPAPLPFTDTEAFELRDVDCTPAGACFATALTTYGTDEYPFVARLVGDRATVTPQPIPSNHGTVNGTGDPRVSCSSASLCVTAGRYHVGDPELGSDYPYLETLSHGVWTVHTIIDSVDVSCTVDQFCGAAGVARNGAGVLRTLTFAP